MKKLFLLCIAISFSYFANAQTLMWSGGYGPGYAAFTRDTLGVDGSGNTIGNISINVNALPGNQHVIDIELLVFVQGDGTEANPDQYFSKQIGPPSYLPLSITTLDQSYAYNAHPGYSVEVEFDWCVIYLDDDNNTTTDFLTERYYY